jgi:hypothetical protein
MIKIAGQRIAVKHIRTFFEITESKPKDLIQWLEEYKYAEFPCNRKRYMEKYTLYRDRWEAKNLFVRTNGTTIYFPHTINIWKIWEELRTHPKSFKQFKKELLKLLAKIRD